MLDQSAKDVWAAIRDFGRYDWSGVELDTLIEEDKAGDQVSAVRKVSTPDRVIRQVLLAHSDLDRSYTYAFCDPASLPVHNYVPTIRVTPVTETTKAFVEWWATFDCPAQECDRWTQHFEKEGFANWLDGLRRFMTRRLSADGLDDQSACPRLQGS